MGHYLVAPWNALENRKMGVGINGGSPKWLVHDGKSYYNE